MPPLDTSVRTTAYGGRRLAVESSAVVLRTIKIDSVKNICNKNIYRKIYRILHEYSPCTGMIIKFCGFSTQFIPSLISDK